MGIDLQEHIYDLQAKQKMFEQRLEESEEKLAVSIDKLCGVVDRLNSKLDTFVELHQRFVMNILIILCGIFLGKEVVMALAQYFLKI